MLTIRLSRVGKKKQATFKVIVSEKAKDTVGDYLELLGHYNPHTNNAELKTERIQYWISKGAQASGTVHNLLVDKKIITGEKLKVANIKKKKEEAKPATPVTPKVEAKPVAPVEVKKEEPAATTPKPEEKPATPIAEKKEELKAPVEEKKVETPAS
jgi:small subunit ribosomal protein S16